MTTTYALKLGDTRPALRATLRDADGTASDLTGLTAMVCRLRRSDRPLLTLLEKTVTLEDAANGVVRVDWVTGDSEALGVGWVEGEFHVEVAGEPVTWPSEGYVGFRVWDEIDRLGS